METGDPGIAAKAFKFMGVDLDQARSAVEKIIGNGSDVVMEEPPLTAGAKRLLESARKEALKLNPDCHGFSYIGTEHLLLALINEKHNDDTGRDIAHEVLVNLSINLAKLKEHILSLEPDARLISGFVAANVITFAKEESQKLGHNCLRPEVILLGLIQRQDSLAGRVLKLMSVDLARARTEVENIIGRGNDSMAEEISFSPETRVLLELAREEAKELGHGYLGTEHVLLAPHQ